MTYEEFYGIQMRGKVANEGHRPRLPGEVSQNLISPLQLKCLNAMEGHMASREVAAAIGSNTDSVSSAISALRARGLVEVVGSEGAALIYQRKEIMQ